MIIVIHQATKWNEWIYCEKELWKKKQLIMSGPKETQQEMKNKVTDICQSGKCKKDISKDVGLQQITVRAIINK